MSRRVSCQELGDHDAGKASTDPPPKIAKTKPGWKGGGGGLSATEFFSLVMSVACKLSGSGADQDDDDDAYQVSLCCLS